MNYIFDIDGTITAAPAALRAIMHGLVSTGHMVHVLTGTGDSTAEERHYQARVTQLNSYGIHCPSHYHYLHIVSSPGNIEAKVRYCLDHHAVLVFEDSQQYTEAMRAAGIQVVTFPYG